MKNLYKRTEDQSKEKYLLRKQQRKNRHYVEDESRYYNELPEFKITNGENDWKFEFVISHLNDRRIRPKIYSKTAEK